MYGKIEGITEVAQWSIGNIGTRFTDENKKIELYQIKARLKSIFIHKFFKNITFD